MTAVFSDELRARVEADFGRVVDLLSRKIALKSICLLYTSDAADE